MDRSTYHALLAIAADSTRRHHHQQPHRQPDTTVRSAGHPQFALVAAEGVWRRRRVA